MPVGRYWMSVPPERPIPRRRPIEIRFGAPITVADTEHRHVVMERVGEFFAEPASR
jgi:hypothetical protein